MVLPEGNVISSIRYEIQNPDKDIQYFKRELFFTLGKEMY
jgi:hypothetical protein